MLHNKVNAHKPFTISYGIQGLYHLSPRIAVTAEIGNMTTMHIGACRCTGAGADFYVIAVFIQQRAANLCTVSVSYTHLDVYKRQFQYTLFFCALETFFRHAPGLVIIHENASPDTAAVSPRCFS